MTRARPRSTDRPDQGDGLPAPDHLWWRFALLAARDRIGPPSRRRDGAGFSYDERDRLLAYDDLPPTDGAGGVVRHRLRMQRWYGRRAVVWGSHPDAVTTSPPTLIPPAWAGSDALADWMREEPLTFLAWHARDGWEVVPEDADVAAHLAPVLGADLPAEVASIVDRDGAVPLVSTELATLLGAGDHAPAVALLRAAEGVPAPTAAGRVRHLLAAEIRAQMSATEDRDRLLPQRPAQVVHWSRVAAPAPGFGFGVYLEGDALVPALGNSPVPEPFGVGLLNVLDHLHRDDATVDGGRWLFARVSFDGVLVHVDRAFDGRPWWYEDDGPSLETLTAEMARRAPAWRPPWSRLLPPPG